VRRQSSRRPPEPRLKVRGAEQGPAGSRLMAFTLVRLAGPAEGSHGTIARAAWACTTAGESSSAPAPGHLDICKPGRHEGDSDGRRGRLAPENGASGWLPTLGQRRQRPSWGPIRPLRSRQSGPALPRLAHVQVEPRRRRVQADRGTGADVDGWDWWAVQDSNLRHPRCKRGALTTELTAREAAVAAQAASRPVSRFAQAASRPRVSGRGWCPGRDLNPDGLLHTPLKRTRIPIPPPGHELCHGASAPPE
jgi:hypothetical protein